MGVVSPVSDRLLEVQNLVDDHILVAVTDEKGTIIKVNRAFARLSGYESHELVGQNHSVLMSGIHSRDFWKHMGQTVKGGHAWHGQVCNRAKNGDVFWVDMAIFPLKDETDRITAYLSVQIAITGAERVGAALVDGLTGLASRAFVLHRLKSMLRRSAERPHLTYAVLFIDLDNFKYVNDSHGHTAGDRLLIETARRLSAAARASEGADPLDSFGADGGPIVGRFGGDEFVILLSDLTSVDEAVRVADRIRHSMSAPVIVADDAIAVQCSIGIASGTGQSGYADSDALLRDADTAMYQAKALGKSRHALFDETMHTNVRRRLKLENDLRRAVEAGAIETEYQPIVELESGRVVSFEALARWTHQDLGPISPAEFIPIAEETGLIIPLAFTQLNRSLDLLASLSRRPDGRTIRMNVNVSRRQLCDPSFLESLRYLLRRNGVAANRLSLEITESVVAASPERVRDALHALKALGVQLHMDDFGTGLSSLSLLRTLPLDGIKIDRSFLEAAEGSREAIAILHAIIMLGRHLQKTVTAEGLESPLHVATVIGLECDLAQGWAFGRALRAADVPAALDRDFASVFLNRDLGRPAAVTRR